MRDFRDLKVWQKAHAMTLRVYAVTKRFPADERFGLTSQIRRAAYSIPSNLAEGCGRRSNPEMARFIQIAMGSGSELRYQLLLARDLDYADPEAYAALAEQLSDVRRMLTGLYETVAAEAELRRDTRTKRPTSSMGRQPLLAARQRANG